MTDIAFYHLTASSKDDALPILLNKTIVAGKKAMVVCDPESMQNLSSSLWSFGHTSSGRSGASYGGEGKLACPWYCRKR